MQTMNSKVAYIQALLFIGCKKNKNKIVVVCEEKKIMGGKRERKILFYYFIGLYVKIKTRM